MSVSSSRRSVSSSVSSVTKRHSRRKTNRGSIMDELVKNMGSAFESSIEASRDVMEASKEYFDKSLEYVEQQTGDLEEIKETVEEKIGGKIRLATIGRLPNGGKESRDHSPHVTDEVINAATHFIGFMLAVLGGALLIAYSATTGDAWKIVSLSVYSTTLMFLFLASSLHHAFEGPAHFERTLLTMDYAAIFPLIAGSFTPMCLVFLHDSFIGWVFFGVLWFFALIGMLMLVLYAALTKEELPKWITSAMYLTMGWMAAMLAPTLLSKIGGLGLFLLVLGGLFYTVGGVIFTIEEPNPFPGTFGFHEIWHIMVLLGAFTHYFMMLLVVVPYDYSK